VVTVSKTVQCAAAAPDWARMAPSYAKAPLAQEGLMA
jgi:hypothetical protein